MNELLHFSRSPNRWQDADARLTPHERFADDVQRMENLERYKQQAPASLPPQPEGEKP